MEYNIKEILELAQKIEEDGEVFYRKAASSASTMELKKLLTYLADEEVKHALTFKKMLNEIEKYESLENFPDDYFLYIKSYADGVIFPNFTDVNLSSPEEVLDFAIRKELDTILYYHEMKEMLPDDEKGILDKIIKEERKHYLTLLDFKRKQLVV